MDILKADAGTLIRNWNSTIKKSPVGIKLIVSDQSDQHENQQFLRFTEEMKTIAPNLGIEVEKGDKELPGFLIKENIIYSALPLEKELEPFLELLSQLNNPFSLSNVILQHLEKIDRPVRLTLFIALSCPHCPDVVRTVIPLAFHCKHIHLHIIDTGFFPAPAQNAGVMSAPSLLMDDDFKWTGSVSREEITQVMVNRDPARLSSGTLRNILEDGDAAWISRKMIEKETFFDAFFTLLLHETWSVRLGAMVIMEEISSVRPDLAVKACPVLIDLFDGQVVPVQGDILYTLGEAGDGDTREWIYTKLSGFTHQELMDAATEALVTLDSKK